mmetsp:Transcript_29929/g.93614  ORF Transcript_29929/g.93614 Transcript_29929/m.93614 type:complete len:238 (-) Transcript_29929:477-1190(-)
MRPKRRGRSLRRPRRWHASSRRRRRRGGSLRAQPLRPCQRLLLHQRTRWSRLRRGIRRAAASSTRSCRQTLRSRRGSGWLRSSASSPAMPNRLTAPTAFRWTQWRRVPTWRLRGRPRLTMAATALTPTTSAPGGLMRTGPRASPSPSSWRAWSPGAWSLPTARSRARGEWRTPRAAPAWQAAQVPTRRTRGKRASLPLRRCRKSRTSEARRTRFVRPWPCARHLARRHRSLPTSMPG